MQKRKISLIILIKIWLYRYWYY